MELEPKSSYLQTLRNRINLDPIPFSERGSRLLVYFHQNHFRIDLAERWFKPDADPTTVHKSHNTMLENFQLTDETDAPLEVTATTYPHAILLDTRIGRFALTFVDPETLLLALPPAECGIAFQANLDQVQTDRRGAVLRIVEESRRNMAVTTNAPIQHSEAVTAGVGRQIVRLKVDATSGGKAILMHISPRMGFNRHVPDVHHALDRSASLWHAWFDAAPKVSRSLRSQYYYAWWIMRAGLISSRYYTTREAMTPSKTHYIGVWQWDNFFHVLAFRHIDSRLAQDQIRILLDHQRFDGMIPDAIYDSGVVTRLTHPIEADVTKPPLLGWAAWKLYETDGDLEFLNELYEPLVRWTDWWFDQNDVDGNGLCEYQHPYSSGLDNSPLWDGGMPVESPDLNTYLYLQLEALARIADAIGEPSDSARFSERAAAIVTRMISQSWDRKAGLFWARHNGDRVNVRTPFSLLPLLCGGLPHEIAERLVAHLTDPTEFWSRYPVPTVALSDPEFSAWRMWRGPTWVNINYLLIEGLLRSGYPNVARELRQRTLEMLSGQNDIYEYYDAQTGQNPPDAASIFGWSAALFIDLAIQATRDQKNERAERVAQKEG